MLRLLLLLVIGLLVYQLLQGMRSKRRSRIVDGEQQRTVSRIPRDDIEDAEFSECETSVGDEERGQKT